MLGRLIAATFLLTGCGDASSPKAGPPKPVDEPAVLDVGAPPTVPEPRLDVASEPDTEAGKVAEADPEPEPAVAPTFSVVARLLDAGAPTSHCGIAHFKVVMKYEVLRVVDGAFEGKTLYAGVSCPEMPPTRTRKFRFTVGETYELKLRTAGLRRAGVKVDAFEDEPGKRYELLHIEPAPSPRRYSAK